MKRQNLFPSFWSSLTIAMLATGPAVAEPVQVPGVRSRPTVSGISVKQPPKAKIRRANATKTPQKRAEKPIRTPTGSAIDLTTKSNSLRAMPKNHPLNEVQFLTQGGQQPQEPTQPPQSTGDTNSTVRERLRQWQRQPSSQPTNIEVDTQIVPVPNYLNPSSNPLQFPTRPEEVQILGTQPITLAQALELARRNNRDLQVAQLTVERDRAALREALAAEYPRLNLTSNVVNNNNNVFSEDPGPSALEQRLGLQQDTDNSTVRLGTTLQLIYDLYTSGSRRASIRRAEEQLRFTQLDFERISEELRLGVATDYYDLQQSDESVRIQRSAVNNAQASLRDAQALEQAGVGTRFAVLQSQVQLAQANQALTNALSQQRIARRELATQLSLPETVLIVTADPVEIAGLWNLSLEESIVGAYQKRAELQQQLAQRNANEQLRRFYLAELGPQISLSARYDLNDTFEDDDSFTDAYSMAANLSLQLFDGGAARARARQAEANIAIAETNFAQQRNNIRLGVEEAFFNLQSSLENVQTASVALEQAREALRLARLRFQAGVGTQTEVIDAEDDLTQAEGDRVQAILDYNRALARLQRSVSSGTER